MTRTFRGCDGRRIRMRRKTEEEVLRSIGYAVGVVALQAVFLVICVIAGGVKL